MATTILKLRQDLIKKSKVKGIPTTIYVQYCYGSKIKLFNTGKKIDPDFWDQENESVKRAYKGYTSINAVIESKKKEIERIVDEAHFKKIAPTLEYVEEQYNLINAQEMPDVSKDFFKLYEAFIADSKNIRAESTIKQHRTTINHLKDFEKAKGYKVTLKSIDLNFYNKFTSYLINEKSQAPNTIGNWIKNIKIFLGSLTEKGINENLSFKSRKFKKPSAPTEIITLTQKELDILFNFDLSKNRRLDKVRDLFVFGCTTGLRFSDMANLKPENIKPDVIDFTTLKTKDRLIVPLTTYARLILNKYNNVLPPVMSNQKMNDYLKELGQLCGINEPVQQVSYIGSNRAEITVPKFELISTHTARRTFVTQSLERGLRPEIIMKITGHKDIKTMMKYVKLTDTVVKNELLRAWNVEPLMKVV